MSEGTTRGEAAAHILAREMGRRARAIQARIDDVERARAEALAEVQARLIAHDGVDERHAGLIDGLRADLGETHRTTLDAVATGDAEVRQLTEAQASLIDRIAQRVTQAEDDNARQDSDVEALTTRVDAVEAKAAVPGPKGEKGDKGDRGPRGPAGPAGFSGAGGGTSGGAGTVTSVTAGTGISVGGTSTDPVITNSGVNSVTAGTGVSVSGTTALTVTNTGVTSLTGSGVIVSASTGAVTVTAPTVSGGTGISVAGSGTTSLTVSATGVNSVTAGTGISVSGTTALTVSATGVQSLTAGNGITVSGTTTPTVSASLAAGTGIGISGTTTLTVSNSGVTSIVAGTGITVSAATGAVTVTSSGGGGPTQVTFAESTASPNATVYVDSMTAAATTTNADLALRPKGTGALTAHVADSTATGGNKRGTYATDWQRNRTSATQVASGTYDTISGGYGNMGGGGYAVVGGGYANSATNNTTSVLGGTSNTASQSNCVVSGGNNNVASGNSAATVGGGSYNTANNNRATVGGGAENTASGEYSCIAGGYQGGAELYGKFVHASGYWSVGNYAQFGRMVLRGITADASTARVLTANGSATASASNTVVLRNNAVYSYQIELVASSAEVGSGAVYGTWGGNWSLSGLIRRTATAATTALIGTPSVTAANIDTAISTCAVALTANVTLGGLAITVTGVAATNIRWVAVVKTTEVG